MFTDIQDPVQRAKFIKDTCDSVTEGGYTRRFTHEEIRELEHRLSELSISSAAIEERKKTLMDEIKQELKPIDEELSSIVVKLRDKSEYCQGFLYTFIDEENRTLTVATEDGQIIEQRPLFKGESIQRQLKFTGTDNV